MFRAHVLIVRRAELYYTVSGIITPVGGRPVHRCTRVCTLGRWFGITVTGFNFRHSFLLYGRQSARIQPSHSSVFCLLISVTVRLFYVHSSNTLSQSTFSRPYTHRTHDIPLCAMPFFDIQHDTVPVFFPPLIIFAWKISITLPPAYVCNDLHIFRHIL